MINHITQFFSLLFTEKQEYMWIGVCMVSAIIVAIGIIKFFFKLDKIKCDWLKNIILSVISVASCFVATAITFWTKQLSFEFYWVTAGIVSAVTTLVYHSYAKWGIKNFVHFVGSKTLGKFFGAFSSAKDLDELQAHIAALPSEVKAATKKQNNTHDNELTNL